MDGKPILRVNCIKEAQMRATLDDIVTMPYKIVRGSLQSYLAAPSEKVAEFSWRQGVAGIFEARLRT
jgi:hypothetical protein